MNTDVSWWDYARAYDKLCEINYHYQELLEKYATWLRTTYSDNGSGIRVCDLGAGTGNFLLRTCEILPDAELHHVDWNSEMTSVAASKYEKQNAVVRIHKSSADCISKLDQEFDLVLMINSLYSFPNPTTLLKSIFDSISPGGHAYIVDTGRPIKTHSFSWDLMTNALSTRGLLQTIQLYRELLPAVRVNRKIEKAGKNGEYWRHDLAELSEAVLCNDVSLLEADICYRGIADRVIARKQIGGQTKAP